MKIKFNCACLSVLAGLAMDLAAQAGITAVVSSEEIEIEGVQSWSQSPSALPYWYGRSNASTLTAKTRTGYRFLGWYTMAAADESRDGVNAAPEKCTVCVAETQSVSPGSYSLQTSVYLAGSRATEPIPVICPKYVKVWNVTAEVSPSAAGTVGITPSSPIDDGKSCTLKANPDPGYSFKAWNKKGTQVSTRNPYEFTVSASAAFTAVFTGNVYRVQLYRDGGEGSRESVQVTYGETMPKLEATDLPKKTGNTFKGFYESQGGQGNKYYGEDGTGLRVWDTPRDGSLYAYWMPNDYDLNLVKNPGIAKICYRVDPDENYTEITATTTVKVPFGSRWYAYAVAEPDYRTDTSRDNPKSETMTVNGATFSPQAVMEGFALTVDPNGGVYRGSSDPIKIPDQRLKYNTKNLNDIGVPTCEGKRFNGFWADNEMIYDQAGRNVNCSCWYGAYPDGVFIGDRDLCVSARWRDIITYTIRFDSNGGTGVMPDIPDVDYEAEVKLPPNLFENGIRTFSHWTTTVDQVAVRIEDEATVSNLCSVADGTNTLHAVWHDEYAIAFDGHGADSGEMPAKVFSDLPGQSETLPVNKFKKTGYTFLGWATNLTRAAALQKDFDDAATLASRPAFAAVGMTNTLYAIWKTNEYWIAYRPGGGGKGEMPDQPFVYDEPQALTSNAFTRTGFWKFSCWSNEVDGAVYEDGDTVLNLASNQDERVELTAVWETTLSKLARAMHCDTLDWDSLDYRSGGAGNEWQSVFNSPGSGHESDSCAYQTGGTPLNQQALVARIEEPGTLSFWWQVSDDACKMMMNVHPDLKNIGFSALAGESKTWNSYTFEITEEDLQESAAVYVKFLVNANSTELSGKIDGMTWTPKGSHPEPGPGDEPEITGMSVSPDGKTFILSFMTKAEFDYNLMTNAEFSVEGWGVKETLQGDGGDKTFEPEIDDAFKRFFYRIETIQRK